MITLYSGTPGSYKSYHAVKECLDWLKLGRNLITNFPLNYNKKIKNIKGDYIFLSDDKITVNFLINYAKEHHERSVHAQTLVVIDEASIKFNPREFGRSDRMDWIKFFSTHRHFNYDFILITQNPMMLDKQIRGLIETEIRHRDMKQANLPCYVISKILGGVYCKVEYWFPVKYKISLSFGLFNKKIASCYDTMALFEFKNI